MYDINTYEKTFSEIIEGDYIKLKTVTQNYYGDEYAITYIDDGKFRLRTFKKENRTDEEIEANEFKINEAIGLDDHTMPNNGFSDPYIVCCFIGSDRLFVALFHNKNLQHKHFIFDMKKKEIIGKVQDYNFADTSEENFPVDCFYNDA